MKTNNDTSKAGITAVVQAHLILDPKPWTRTMSGVISKENWKINNKKVVYISGKITGLPQDQVEAKFQKSEDFLLGLGFRVVNPRKLSHQHGGTWEEYMREDLTGLLLCNVIFLQPDWKQSNGAVLERSIAHKLKFEVIYETHE